MRITANQVTFTRILLMPPIGFLLYGSDQALVAAVILGTLVGCTDFVDGYLARKHGPTVLGGLMDPIADKVFVAVAFLPYADRQWMPWWPIALLFLREFVVTAMRSSFERRHQLLKTTYLAKVKTWVQMCGIGLLFLQLVHVPKLAMSIVLGTCAIGALAGGIVARAVGRRWRGSWIFFACFSGNFAVYWFATAHYDLFLLGTIVAITWASGIDYLVVGGRELAKSRDVHLWDAVRLIGAAALPVLALLALVRTEAPAWAIIVLVSLELAHGGLDNLLAHHGAASPAWAWGGRILGASALLGVALLLPEHAAIFAIAAVAVSGVGTALSFFRNRHHFLDEKWSEKKRSPAVRAAAES